jgi:hypothetical protein
MLNWHPCLRKFKTQFKNSIKHYAEWEESESAMTDESTPEDRNSVADLKASVQEFNNSIAEVIDDLMNEEEEKQEPTPHPTPNAQEPVPVPAPVPVPPSASDKEEKKRYGSRSIYFGSSSIVAYSRGCQYDE